MISLTLPVPPSANRLWRNGRGRTYKTNAAKSYELAVLAECRRKRVEPVRGKVAVGIVWYRDRKAGDLDNKIKPCLDALKGLAFGDDALVYHLTATLMDGHKPGRLEVTIAPVGTPKS